MDIIFLIGRIIFGGFFLFNGINHFKHLADLTSYTASKKVPSPKMAVILTGVLLLLGGLGVLFGVYTSLSLWLLIIFLVPMSIIMHPFWKETDPQAKMIEMTSFMKNIALAGACLMLLQMSIPWVLSL
ncbi:MAG: DoxX family membrane protein [Candidatus Pacebacteria bacterium]|nr:DoxX family membrane protein [Candidatus Paceibacterota bacterium]